MAVIRLESFAAAYPVRDPRLLPVPAASAAGNMDTDGGALRPISGAALISSSVLASTRSVFRVPTDRSAVASGTYVQFDDPDTDVVRGPSVNDSFERYYWASPSTGLRFASRTRLLSLGAAGGLVVGVPRPAAAPVLQVVGAPDSTPNVTRSYVVTFVNEFGEEGQPSFPVEAVGKASQIWRLSNIPQPASDPARATVVALRIYRTITALSGTTQFALVQQILTGVLTYDDTGSDTLVSAQGVLPSTLWAPPLPMDGIVSMPNGILLGWKGNRVYFSEPYRPHAWPAEYTISVPSEVVAVGVVGNTAVLATTSNPSLVTGVSPAAMSITPVDFPAPCLHRGGLVATSGAVFYPSDDGLISISPSGTRNITREVISRDEWRRVYCGIGTPEFSLRAVVLNEDYLAFRTVGGAAANGFSLSLADGASSGVTEIVPPAHVRNVVTDRWTGQAVVLIGTQLFEWAAAAADPLTVSWASKTFDVGRPTNMSVLELYAPENPVVTVRVYTDPGVSGSGWRLVFDGVVQHRRLRRLPDGFKSAIWMIEVVTTGVVEKITLASTITELRRG